MRQKENAGIYADTPEDFDFRSAIQTIGQEDLIGWIRGFLDGKESLTREETDRLKQKVYSVPEKTKSDLSGQLYLKEGHAP